jgi:hypothetical protein
LVTASSSTLGRSPSALILFSSSKANCVLPMLAEALKG